MLPEGCSIPACTRGEWTCTMSHCCRLGIALWDTLWEHQTWESPERQRLSMRWVRKDTYRFWLGGVEQVLEGFVCCPQQRPDRTGPFLSVFFSSFFRIVAQECTKEARVGVLHQFDLQRPIQIQSYGRRHQLNARMLQKKETFPSQSNAFPSQRPIYQINLEFFLCLLKN